MTLNPLTAASAGEVRFQRWLFERIFMVRFVVYGLYVLSLVFNPYFADRNLSLAPFVPVVLLALALAYFVVSRRSIFWATMLVTAVDLVNAIWGAWVGLAPIPLTLLFVALPAAGVALQIGGRAGVATLALGVAGYLIVVYPLVMPDPVLAASFTLLSAIIVVGVGVMRWFFDVNRRSLEAEHLRADTERARLQTVLDASRDPMTMFDLDGQLVALNRAAATMFGVAPHDVLGKNLAELEPTIATIFRPPPAGGDRPGFYQELGEAEFEGTVMQQHPVTREFATFSPLTRGDDGKPTGRLWVFRDVTAERQAERDRSEFMALATHELRSPLTSMRAFVDLMLEEGYDALPEDRRRGLVRVMQANTERWMGLVDNLLTLSRIESALFGLRPVSQPASEVLGPVMERFEPQFLGKDHYATWSVAPLTPPLWADPFWFGVVLSNLVSNAVKYTPRGGHVSVAAGPAPAGGVRFQVTDSGIGISPENQLSLFTKFYRVRSAETRDTVGSGLGLAIVKTLMDLHGGSVLVESQPGTGSSFGVVFPAAALAAPAEA